MTFPSKSIQTDGISAGVMSSFDFGQVGGTALVVDPCYALAAAPPSVYESYKIRHEERYLKSIVQSYVGDDDDQHAGEDQGGPPRTQLSSRPLYTFKENQPTETKQNLANVKAIEETLKVSRSTAADGVDQELISSVPTENHTFILRNFTDAEIADCCAQPSFRASFAARWVAEEAVFKSLGRLIQRRRRRGGNEGDRDSSE